MALAWWLLMQAASGPAPSSPPIPPIDFDLAKVKPAEEPAPPSVLCDRGDGEEILVCGRKQGPVGFSAEEMEKLAKRYAEKPVQAIIDLGGGAGAGIWVDPGPYGPRIMFGIKIPF